MGYPGLATSPLLEVGLVRRRLECAAAWDCFLKADTSSDPRRTSAIRKEFQSDGARDYRFGACRNCRPAALLVRQITLAGRGAGSRFQEKASSGENIRPAGNSIRAPASLQFLTIQAVETPLEQSICPESKTRIRLCARRSTAISEATKVPVHPVQTVGCRMRA